MRRREDEQMRRWDDVKVFDRPPLLEEPFAQTLWEKLAGTKQEEGPTPKCDKTPGKNVLFK